MDEGKSKRGSVKEKERTKAITEIYLTRLLSVKVGLRCAIVTPYFYRFSDTAKEKKMQILVICSAAIWNMCHVHTSWCSRFQVINMP